ncbi:hypothetical protein C5B85_04760 [Pseudoclavibacter sp. AY1F1]|uniref:TetR/AcrR family transcriptional regulator n=1 Tax=Pseudoclavibacter sp. AY1F1 TaxID=2080583 RepID=UPI000CE8195F|nr:TetR family transcriptional regulator [Pseudoclavibacter sp. AY1F1]PPF45977.1 hypothetical protein C5B85_04760 [Pseudoclavibacter sp. AY1F1]
MATSQERKRQNLRVVDDEQARATRSRLLAAVREIAAENVQRPSVTLLCERSGVARSTFYTHFATVEDLAVQALTEVFGEVSADDVRRRIQHRESGRDIARDGLDRVIAALEGSRELLDYTIGIGSRAAVLESLIGQFAASTLVTVVTEYSELDASVQAFINDYVSAGTAHTILAWMENPGARGRDDLIEQLVDLLPARLVS